MMIGGTTTRRWLALNEIFCAAHPLRGDARERLIAERCAADPALATEVRALLRAADTLGPLDALAARLAPVPELLADPVPERVGPYVVTGELGQGGMGTVYRAHDPRLRRDVALKFYPRALRNDDAGRARFVAEARAASALDHPHLCTIYDVGALPDGRMYLAMSYCPRGTLADRLEAGPLPVDEAVRIAAEIADGLAGAHAAGIIHRDVKPRNIAFGERGEARLLDFGVALLTDGAALDGADTAGTPAYMSPEQVRGGPIDARADLWALGVVLFEMLTGRRPFEGESRSDVLRRILLDGAPDLARAAPHVPPAVVRVVRRALRKDRDDRWRSAIKMKAALERAIAPARTRRAGWRSAATVAVMLAVGGAAAIAARPLATRVSPGQASYERARQHFLRFTRAEYESAITYLRDALARDPRHAPAHALLARAFVEVAQPQMSRAGQQHWLDSAGVHARQAIALAPRRGDGYAALALLVDVNGGRDSAEALYRRALAVDPRYGVAGFELARLLFAAKRYREGVHLLERAIVDDPHLPDGRRYAAMFYRLIELHDEAWRHVRAGLAATPADSRLLLEAAQVAAMARDDSAARQWFAKAEPYLEDATRERVTGWFYMTLGDMPAARRHIARVLPTARFPNDLRFAGLVYGATGDRAKGDSLLALAASQLRPSLTKSFWRSQDIFTLGHVYAAMGRRDEALTMLQEWSDMKGIRSWEQLDMEPGWEALRDDARFREIVRVTRGRFLVKQREAVDALAEMRKRGELQR